jgi:probable rRNA maturation factor
MLRMKSIMTDHLLENDFDIHVQVALEKDFPFEEICKKWLFFTLKERVQTAEITLRVVDISEMISLNLAYRGKNTATNVLSFPLEQSPLVGDIVICLPVIEKEAMEQNKSLPAHLAHMLVHGTLHLLGYDHILTEEAEIMEKLEVKILQDLGFSDPYKE